MLAEVVPAAPGAGFFFVGVFAFAALIVCIGLLRGIQYTLVPFLHWIARGLGHIPLAGPWLASHVEDAKKWLAQELGTGINHLEHGATFLWNGVAAIARDVAHEIEHLSHATWATFHQLRYVYMPNWIRNHSRYFVKQADAHAVRRERVIRRDVAHEHRVTGALAGAMAGVEVRTRDASHGAKARARARAREAAKAEAGGGTAVAVEAGTAARARAAQRARVSRLEKSLGVLGIAGLVAIGLHKLGLEHLRCSRNRRFGKMLCGAPLGLLEGLLGGAIEALVTIDLCRLSRIATVVAVRFEPELRALVVVVNAALCGGTRQKPPALAFRRYTPPVARSPLAL